MNYQFFAQTDTGLHRSNNEDAAAFDAPTRLCLVADGMGGYHGGEIASGMAIRIIQAEMTRWLIQAGDRTKPQDVRRALDVCVENTNLAILKAAHASAQYSNMGTTLVVGVFLRDQLVLGHVGDSRCYRFRDGRLVQLTRDHSLLQEQLDAGLITPQQAALSDQRNLVTRALGVEYEVDLDVTEHAVQAEDLYLMCTDGLTDMLSDAEIGSILQNDDSLDVLTRQHIQAANAQGGRDNIGVLVALAKADAKKPTIVNRLLHR